MSIIRAILAPSGSIISAILALIGIRFWLTDLAGWLAGWLSKWALLVLLALPLVLQAVRPVVLPTVLWMVPLVLLVLLPVVAAAAALPVVEIAGAGRCCWRDVLLLLPLPYGAEEGRRGVLAGSLAGGLARWRAGWLKHNNHQHQWRSLRQLLSTKTHSSVEDTHTHTYTTNRA